MYIASIVNPLTKSSADVSVVLLCHKQTRKIVRRPKTYEDMVRIVRDKFTIERDASIAFETSTLDICNGLSVEIDESAYEAVSTVLDEIVVVTGPGAQEKIQRPPTPLASAVPEDGAANAQIEARDNGEDVEELQNPHEEDSGVPLGKRTVPAARRRPVNFIFDESSDEAGDEGVRGSATRGPVEEVSGSESEGGEDRGEDIPPSSDEADEEDNEDLRSGRDGKARELERADPHEPVVAKDETKKAGPSQRREHDTDKLIKKEKVTPSKSALKARPNIPATDDSEPNSQQSQSRSGSEPRYKIHISGPLADQKAEILTRGRHPVRKVLSVACNKFGIDYDQARLMLVVSIPDEDGTEMEHKFECAKGETMIRSGVEDGARLVVEVVDDDD